MLKKIISWILKLFGISKTASTSALIGENGIYNDRYEDIDRINFAAIFASRLSILATSDSNIDVSGENKRADAFREVSDGVWRKISKITARALGTGGVVLVPYVQDGKVLIDVVSQDRLCINATVGSKITSVTLLAETVKISNTTYYRWTTYEITNGVCYITTKVTDGDGKPTFYDQWDGIADISIANVDRVPICYMKSPKDNRQATDYYGVPLTYGCEETIAGIYVTLHQIADEYELKRVRLQADERMFDRDKNGKPVLRSTLFMPVPNPGNETVFNVFDPAIRDSAFAARLEQQYAQLEKEVGTDRGVLTEPQTRAATATEIKQSNIGTYAIVSAIRAAIADMFDDLKYACDVLENCFSITPQGEYKISFDWDMSLIESSSETWSQYKDARAAGAISTAELRQWLTNESAADAEKAVEAIKANEPSLTDLIGS